MKKQQAKFYADENLKNKINQFASNKGISFSNAVELILKEYFDIEDNRLKLTKKLKQKLKNILTKSILEMCLNW